MEFKILTNKLLDDYTPHLWVCNPHPFYTNPVMMLTTR